MSFSSITYTLESTDISIIPPSIFRVFNRISIPCIEPDLEFLGGVFLCIRGIGTLLKKVNAHFMLVNAIVPYCTCVSSIVAYEKGRQIFAVFLYNNIDEFNLPLNTVFFQDHAFMQQQRKLVSGSLLQHLILYRPRQNISHAYPRTHYHKSRTFYIWNDVEKGLEVCFVVWFFILLKEQKKKLQYICAACVRCQLPMPRFSF